MGRSIIKAHQDLDLYIEWSSIVDAPTFVGSRVEMFAYLVRGDRHGRPTGEEVEERLARTDKNGSSMMDTRSGYWDDEGEIPATDKGQRWLRRDRLGAYCILVAIGDNDGAYLLTEPLDDEGVVTADAS